MREVLAFFLIKKQYRSRFALLQIWGLVIPHPKRLASAVIGAFSEDRRTKDAAFGLMAGRRCYVQAQAKSIALFPLDDSY